MPDGTEELVVYIGRYEEADGSRKRVVVPFGAVVDGIDPGVRRIPANTLPEGSGFVYYRPYESCPSVKKGQNVLLGLFAVGDMKDAVPSALGTEFVTRLTEEALGVGKYGAGSEPSTTLAEAALAVDWVTATYGPG